MPHFGSKNRGKAQAPIILPGHFVQQRGEFPLCLCWPSIHTQSQEGFNGLPNMKSKGYFGQGLAFSLFF
jgi:hypothetical protein